MGRVGNVFHTLDIEAAICTQQEGKEMMDWSTSMMIGRSMGIDVAGGLEFNHIMQLKLKHHITKIYVDGANPEVIRELKSRIGEYHDYYGRLTEEQVLGFTHQ